MIELFIFVVTRFWLIHPITIFKCTISMERCQSGWVGGGLFFFSNANQKVERKWRRHWLNQSIHRLFYIQCCFICQQINSHWSILHKLDSLTLQTNTNQASVIAVWAFFFCHLKVFILHSKFHLSCCM